MNEFSSKLRKMMIDEAESIQIIISNDISREIRKQKFIQQKSNENTEKKIAELELIKDSTIYVKGSKTDTEFIQLIEKWKTQ